MWEFTLTTVTLTPTSRRRGESALHCRSFALRLRATASKLCGGRGAQQFKTDDVVKDAPLPEFKLDLSTIAAAFAPVRPLRPQRRMVKKVQVGVCFDRCCGCIAWVSLCNVYKVIMAPQLVD